MFCVFGTFWKYFKFEKEGTKSHPAVETWEASGWQEAGNIIGRERCDDSASV